MEYMDKVLKKQLDTSVRNTGLDTLERDDDENLSTNQYMWCNEFES